MPFYRYKCDICGYTFKVLQSVNGNSVIACENCGAESMRRVLSRIGVVYKGSGFYSTDYNRKKDSNSKKEDKDSDSKD